MTINFNVILIWQMYDKNYPPQVNSRNCRRRNYQKGRENKGNVKNKITTPEKANTNSAIKVEFPDLALECVENIYKRLIGNLAGHRIIHLDC